MINIVVVFPKDEDAKSIRSLLQRRGYSVAMTCTSGTAALQAADRLHEGIVLCGYRFRDMLYEQLYQNLPDTFRMLLLASDRVVMGGIPEGVTVVNMPLKVQELLEALDRLAASLEQERRRRRSFPRQRSGKEQKAIDEAKKLLMERNRMEEAEAHRYLQKISMDSGTNLVETAQMLMRLMGN